MIIWTITDLLLVVLILVVNYKLNKKIKKLEKDIAETDYILDNNTENTINSFKTQIKINDKMDLCLLKIAQKLEKLEIKTGIKKVKKEDKENGK